MDWIEQLLGFSPDGGDGTAEAMIVFAACVVVAIVIFARVPKARGYVRNLLGLSKRA
ncbi:hypothetical protein [Bradyrhizobium liaoningense]|uniref:hypothetical protein n=1 Tax=Bradyrhizobium liaoningense TaxID=43992 RepID=UPI001BAB551D|nr:hypothetical protein [Bradyrhizobium liaoningense]MBR0715028.1 hypothetical protein [Bradyrhizobium liaoningense]